MNRIALFIRATVAMLGAFACQQTAATVAATATTGAFVCQACVPVATGGATSIATGGSPSTGGTRATGGSPSNGGTNATGGATSAPSTLTACESYCAQAKSLGCNVDQSTCARLCGLHTTDARFTQNMSCLMTQTTKAAAQKTCGAIACP